MDRLVEALLHKGFGVQLVHEPTETTWEDHGFVRIKASNGNLLAESSNYQHNPFSNTHVQRTAELMAKAKTGLDDLVEGGKGPDDSGEAARAMEDKALEEAALSESEGSTKAASSPDAGDA